METGLSPTFELMFQVPEKSAANAAVAATSEPSASKPCVKARMFDSAGSTSRIAALLARTLLRFGLRARLGAHCGPRLFRARPRLARPVQRQVIGIDQVGHGPAIQVVPRKALLRK